MRKNTPLELKRPLVIFDIESTGTNRQVDRIIDIALLKIHPDGREECCTFRVNPEIPIPPEATAVHGIRDEDVREKPRFCDIADRLLEFLKDCDLGGYNVTGFDIPLLEAEFARAGKDIDLGTRYIVDAQRIYHKKVPRDLPAALQYYCGEMHLEAHDAMGDVRATWRVLQAQLKRYDDLPRDIAGLSEYCNPPDPTRVDQKGKFKWSNGEVVFNFGKYQRLPLREVVAKDPDYLRYLLDKNAVPKDCAVLIKNALEGRYPAPRK